MHALVSYEVTMLVKVAINNGERNMATSLKTGQSETLAHKNIKMVIAQNYLYLFLFCKRNTLTSLMYFQAAKLQVRVFGSTKIVPEET